MELSKWMVALMLLIGGLACSDDPPIRANYTPAECPACGTNSGTTSGTSDDDAPEELGEPLVSEPEPEPSTATPARDPKEPSRPATAAGLVNINDAAAAQLQSLPGVGPALAARIIEYRSQRSFERVEELMRVRGIGPAKFAKMRAMVVVQ